jgi:hypothetical protein
MLPNSPASPESRLGYPARSLARWIRLLERPLFAKSWSKAVHRLASESIEIAGEVRTREQLSALAEKHLAGAQDIELRIVRIERPTFGLWSWTVPITLRASWHDIETWKPVEVTVNASAVVRRTRDRPDRLIVHDWSDPVSPTCGSFGAPAGRPGERLLVVTTANRPHKGLDRLRRSCERVGIQLQVYAKGGPYVGHIHNKLQGLYRTLLVYGNDYDYVLYTDAFDTILTQPADEILRRFHAEDTPFLMSAEANCFPATPRQKPEDYPPAPTRYRFVNAGGFLVRIPYLMELLEKEKVTKLPGNRDDQGWWARVYLDRKYEMKLDHHCRIFQCLYRAKSDVVFDPADGSIRNTITGTRPCVVHGNGSSGLSHLADPFLGEAPDDKGELLDRLVCLVRYVWGKLAGG